MAPEPAGAQGRGRRLHPLSPVFEIGRSFFRIVVPGLIVLLVATGDKSEAWWMLAFVPAFAHSLFRYVTLRYQLTGDHIVIREGLIFRRLRHIPYARIQNIDTVQNPLHRMVGVVEARLETAGGTEPEAVLRVLSTESLEEIRAGVFADHRPIAAGGLGREEETSAPKQRAFFRMGPIDVALFGLLSQKGLALLGGLFFVLWEFGLLERARGWLERGPVSIAGVLSPWFVGALAFLLFVALEILTVVWAFLTLYDFHIVRTKEDLRTGCGLWTRQSATLPRYRIQFVSVREGWLHRRMKRLSVKVLTAGGDSTKESQVSRKWLVPLAGKEELEGILAEVQPEISFAGVDWSGIHPNARRRMFVKWMLVFVVPAALLARHSWWSAVLSITVFGVLAFVLATARSRRLGYTLTDGAILMRDGVWTRVKNAVRFSKIQSVSLSQTPFDRRHGMATLRVDTAGHANSELSFSVPYLPVRTARRLMSRLIDKTAPLAFRW